MKITHTYPVGLGAGSEAPLDGFAVLAMDDKETHFEEYMCRLGDSHDGRADAVALEWVRVSDRGSAGWAWTDKATFVERIPWVVLAEMLRMGRPLKDVATP